MKMICIVWFLILISCVSVAQTQSKAAVSRDEQDRLKQLRLRASGGAALQRVKARIKADQCTHYGSGHPAVECLLLELNATAQDERIYARAIAGMLRIDDAVDFNLPAEAEDYNATRRSGREFDAGESGWWSYRGKACTAQYDRYAGGSIRGYAAVNCRLSLTQNHMLEMETLYDDLWH